METPQLPADWQELLGQEFQQPYFKKLTRFVAHEYAAHTCYPPKKDIFNAFSSCGANRVKVVLLGQDPYHGPGQANGLAFSVHPGMQHPPSLRNIFRELQQDLGTDYPASGDLGHWAQQGVLLLNATLSVRAQKAGSHQGQGWETFTDAVITQLSRHKKGLVFLLWGGQAKKKGRHIDEQRHTVLRAGHPSPLSANRGHWFGNAHFSKTNQILRDQGNKPIVW
ncbi:uracil-DNA glycosylase [Maribacter sp. 2307ULW6-5]|uniref:uracil-DNA glycosylase n=1 Tax=Maribacter sp. 2307ULW6-5 TaxID=3386275 RepID=UPI0039BD1E66